MAKKIKIKILLVALLLVSILYGNLKLNACAECEGPNGHYKALVIEGKKINDLIGEDKIFRDSILGYYFKPTPTIMDPEPNHPNNGRAVKRGEGNKYRQLELYAHLIDTTTKYLGILDIHGEVIGAIGYNSFIYQILKRNPKKHSKFNINEVQYIQNFNGLENSFISKVEIDFLTHKSNYISISGAYVSLSEVKVFNEKIKIKKNYSEKMSTFKFAAFELVRKKEINTILENIYLNHLSNFINRKLSDIDFLKPIQTKHNINEKTKMIPVVTVAAPCPPRWDETN